MASAADLPPDPPTQTEADCRLYQCGQCLRSFARVDHLTRHVLTHTKDKPFKCLTCRKAFARADLAKRHASIHGVTEGEGFSSIGGKFTRTSSACLTCASSKLRCDSHRPCHRCARKGIFCKDKQHRIPRKLDEVSTGRADSQKEKPGDNAGSISNHVYLIGDEYDIDQATSSGTSGPVSADMSSGIVSESPLPSIQAQSYNEYSSKPTNEDVSLEDENLWQSLHPGELSAEDATDQPKSNQLSLSSTVGCKHTPRTSYVVGGSIELDFESGTDLNTRSWNALGLPNVGPPIFGADESLEQIIACLNDSDYVTDMSQAIKDHTLKRGEQSFHADGTPVVINTGQGSLLTWKPCQADSGRTAEDNIVTTKLSLASLDAEQMRSPWILLSTSSAEDRERILSILIENCEQSNVVRIASLFPSLQMLDHLLNMALVAATQTQDLLWLHLPTFKPSALKRELHCALVAYGAFKSNQTTARRLGVAMVELIQTAILRTWRIENAGICDVQLCAAYLLVMQIAFWSGNSRSMTFGESLTSTLVTILRRTGQLRDNQSERSLDNLEDESSDLDASWRSWIEQESRIRLVYAVFRHDVQVSMAMSQPALLSSEEMKLAMPCARELWTAASPQDWKTALLSSNSSHHSHELGAFGLHNSSAARIIQKMSTAVASSLQRMDPTDLPDTTIEILLYGLWNVIRSSQEQYWWWRSGDVEIDPVKVSGSIRHDILSSLMDLFESTFLTLSLERSIPEVRNKILYHLVRLFLCVPLSALPAFAGREGHKEAHRVRPMIEEWSGARPARQSLWHGAQIFRLVALLPEAFVSGITAIAVYQAGLSMCSYALLSTARDCSQTKQEIYNQNFTEGGEMQDSISKSGIRLDEAWSPNVAAFIRTGAGLPTVSSRYKNGNDLESICLSTGPADLILAATSLLQGNAMAKTANHKFQLAKELNDMIEGIAAASR